MLLMTVRVRVRVRSREPRLRRRLEHVTRDASQLVAMRRQMRVSETLRLRLLLLCRMGQDIRWGLLLRECV
jgi:hypothetical protein